MTELNHDGGGEVKVSFRLERDEDGYPPADWEHLWARWTADGLYELDNTPFFARGVSYGDVVAADFANGLYEFREVVRPSGHSTLRVIVLEGGRMQELRASLHDLGCSTELSHLSNLVAVDVPPSVPYGDLTTFLQSGENAGYWEYEEAAVR
jgi:hypothetical protein